MIAGHFGLAAAVKAVKPQIPLWMIMLSTQLLDILFIPLLLLNIESIEPVYGNGYGELIIHAPYTHSLLGAILISIMTGLIFRNFLNKQESFVIGGVVFSHWLLDLLVHRQDLAVLPNNWGQIHLLGFGVWQWPAVSIGVEAFLISLGGIFYIHSVLQRGKWNFGNGKSDSIHRARIAGFSLSVLLILTLACDVLKWM